MVIELTEQFTPAADEVSRLQREKDADALFFQSFCEEGHYKGRTKPSRTRQGIYAVAPSGRLLAACNTRSPRTMERMLRKALDAWKELTPEQRSLDPERREQLSSVTRWRDKYPEDGLVLEVTTRDLERENPPEGWYSHAWNRDYAWFLQAEARSFLPEEPRAGAHHGVPDKLVHRLVEFHLVDNVRGQTSAYRTRNVEEADLRVEVRAVDGDRVHLAMTGATRATHRGRWAVRGFTDRDQPDEQQLGFEAALRGEATFDLAAGRFVAFELIASGTRWGGTQFNSRSDDLQPSPIGVAMRLAPKDAPRVAPAYIWRYGW